MPHGTRTALATALGAVCLVLATATGQTRPEPDHRAPEIGDGTVLLAQDSLTATVRSVGERGIEVIRGVQYFLRITYIAVDSATVIVRDGESSSMEELERGDLVTVHYRETDRGMVARRIVIRSGPGSSDAGDSNARTGRAVSRFGDAAAPRGVGG